MLWVDNDIFIFFDNINNVEFDAQLLCHPQGVIALLFFLILLADSVGMSFYTKTCKEVNALNMHALLLYDLSGKH